MTALRSTSVPPSDEARLGVVLELPAVRARRGSPTRPARLLSSRRCGSSWKTLMPPKRVLADCWSTLMIVSPSRTQVPRSPAKLNSLNLLNTFICRAYCPSGGATYSPITNISSASSRPAMPSQTQKRARRDARGAHHDELAAAREIAEAEQRADQRRDRQQLEQVARQVQRDEQRGLVHGVTAGTDVVLLADEQEQRAEREQHEHHERRVAEHGADDVAAERRPSDFRPPPASRAAPASCRDAPRARAAAAATRAARRCTHHSPSWPAAAILLHPDAHGREQIRVDEVRAASRARCARSAPAAVAALRAAPRAPSAPAP